MLPAHRLPSSSARRVKAGAKGDSWDSWDCWCRRCMVRMVAAVVKLRTICVRRVRHNDGRGCIHNVHHKHNAPMSSTTAINVQLQRPFALGHLNTASRLAVWLLAAIAWRAGRPGGGQGLVSAQEL